MKVNPVRGFHPMVSKQRVENLTPASIKTIFATNESQPTASAMYQSINQVYFRQKRP